ncbi:hypothetical protein [Rhodococcus sp. 14-2496-1d]|uniref:hypothetical protein n=1 Tax=Rhodococcus sp. 14-2496-1d TaxID=2023146 RepID=UPI0015C661A9|nr:hypothetical protein [Rhodococcus sp. 14-2496-1d]
MPKPIASRFGRKSGSVLNGDSLEIDAADATDVVAEMESAGFTCTRDDALIAAACGF